MADMGVGYRMTGGTLVDPPETADERQAAICDWLETIDEFWFDTAAGMIRSGAWLTVPVVRDGGMIDGQG